MDFAVNYSRAAAKLLREGRIQIDRFKCAAWPDLIPTIQETGPVYVHFSLIAGTGIGDAVEGETGQPADWGMAEELLELTDTPVVSVHLAPFAKDYPDIARDSLDPRHVGTLTQHLIRDVRAVVERFGPERVVAENVPYFGDRHPLAASLPEVISHVLEETGCGLLLDLSHAWLAARHLGMDAREYVGALPVDRVREIHVAGIQRVDARWTAILRRGGVDEEIVQWLDGMLMDHLPMVDGDWEFFGWSMGQIHRGAWGRPWVVTFEYGGLSSFFEATTDERVLAEQIPRLRALVKGEAT